MLYFKTFVHNSDVTDKLDALIAVFVMAIAIILVCQSDCNLASTD